MTRLRQKYKNLKKEYDRMMKAPVKFEVRSSNVQTLKVSRCVPREELNDSSRLLEQIESGVAYKFVEMLLNDGYIERRIAKDFYTWPNVEYSLMVVKPFSEGGDY